MYINYTQLFIFQQIKRKIEDVSKKLETLYDCLREDRVCKLSYFFIYVNFYISNCFYIYKFLNCFLVITKHSSRITSNIRDGTKGKLRWRSKFTYATSIRTRFQSDIFFYAWYQSITSKCPSVRSLHQIEYDILKDVLLMYLFVTNVYILSSFVKKKRTLSCIEKKYISSQFLYYIIYSSQHEHNLQSLYASFFCHILNFDTIL